MVGSQPIDVGFRWQNHRASPAPIPLLGFTLIQFGGPLIGGVIALGTTVALPMVPRTNRKVEVKEMRNQAVIWGILVAPLGTAILGFLLNNVVAGGFSCGF